MLVHLYARDFTGIFTVMTSGALEKKKKELTTVPLKQTIVLKDKILQLKVFKKTFPHSNHSDRSLRLERMKHPVATSPGLSALYHPPVLEVSQSAKATTSSSAYNKRYFSLVFA